MRSACQASHLRSQHQLAAAGAGLQVGPLRYYRRPVNVVAPTGPACAQSVTSLCGHNAEVTAVAATDELIVSGGDDKVVCFYAPYGRSNFKIVDDDLAN